MKLTKKTRKALHEAKGKPIWIKWPRSAKPRKGQTYHLDDFDPDTRLMVVGFNLDGFEALVKLNHDPILSLHGLKGIRNENGDYESEPEPVNARYQALLDAEGRQKTARLGMEGIAREKAAEGQRKLLRAKEKGSKGEQRFYERVQRHKEARKVA